MEETLDYLEQVLSGLRARYAAGDKSVETRLRAVSAKIDQLKLQKDLVKSNDEKKDTIRQQLAQAFKHRSRRGCCR